MYLSGRESPSLGRTDEPVSRRGGREIEQVCLPYWSAVHFVFTFALFVAPSASTSFAMCVAQASLWWPYPISLLPCPSLLPTSSLRLLFVVSPKPGCHLPRTPDRAVHRPPSPSAAPWPAAACLDTPQGHRPQSPCTRRERG